MDDETDTGNASLDSASNEKRCDESRCLSTGLMPSDGDGGAIKNPLLFNCYAYGPGTQYPYLCADDHIGVRLSNEDVATSTDPDLHYYTCCPPDENDSNSDSNSDIEDERPRKIHHDVVTPERECENPQEIDTPESGSSSESEDPRVTCQANSPLHPHARYHYTAEAPGFPGFPEAFMCCSFENSSSTKTPMPIETSDSSSLPPPMAGTGTSPIEYSTPAQAGIGLDDGDFASSSDPVSNSDRKPQECYPFLFCEDSCVVENNFLNIHPMNCYNDLYQYPEVTSMSGNTATYQCCSLSQDTDSAFVTTSTAYLATVWTQFTLALIASLMACLLIASIGRSLYLARKNSPPNSTDRRNNILNPDYSSYNIYLILLAIPDLAYNLFMLGIVTEHFNNGWIPESEALITLCGMIFQYMNAIIAREVLTLLRRTKDREPYAPPSCKKTWLSFGFLAVVALSFGSMWMFLLAYPSTTNMERAVRATVAIPLRDVSILLFFILVVIFPAIYMTWVCFEVWHKQLLPRGEFERHSHPSTSTNITAAPTPQSSLKNNHASSDSSAWSAFRESLSSRFLSPRDGSNNTASLNPENSRHNTSSNEVDMNVDNGNSSQDRTTLTRVTIATAANGERTTMTRVITATDTNGERLRALALYFLMIIMVFFFLWLPGMVMYFIGYQMNQNASGLPHNLGLIFLSLHSIVSNGIALAKPDVKKSIRELFGEVFKWCCCCCYYCFQQNKSGNDTATPPGSTRKVSEKWPEGDVEVPIREEEPSDRPIDTASDPSGNRFLTANHEIATIGGIKVSQLMIHSVSSFRSGLSDSDDDDDNDNDDLEFATDAPSSKSERKKKKEPKKNEIKSTDLWDPAASTGSLSLIKESSNKSIDRSRSESLSFKKKKKKKPSGSSLHNRDPPGPPSRKNSRTSTTSDTPGPPSRKNSITSTTSDTPGPLKRKNSRTSKSPDKPGPLKRKNSRTSKSPDKPEPLKRKNSRTSKSPDKLGPSKRKNSRTSKSPVAQLKTRRASGSHLQSSGHGRRASGSHLHGSGHGRRASGSHLQSSGHGRRASGSHILSNSRRRGSGSNSSHNNMLSDPPRRRNSKRLSMGHRQASDSSIGQSGKSFASFDGKAPLVQSRKKSISGGKSPVAQLRKKFDSNNCNLDAKKKSSDPPSRSRKPSKSPIVQSRKTSKSPVAGKKTLTGLGSYVSRSPVASQASRKIISDTNNDDSTLGVSTVQGIVNKIDAGGSSVKKLVKDMESPKQQNRKKINTTSGYVSKPSIEPQSKKISISLTKSTSIDSSSQSQSRKEKKEKRISNSSSIFLDGSVVDNRTVSNNSSLLLDGSFGEYC